MAEEKVASNLEHLEAFVKPVKSFESLDKVLDDKKPDSNESLSLCSRCSMTSTLTCQRCLSIVYCSKECQQKGSSGVKSHRKICAQIRKAKEKVEEEAEKLKFRRRNGKVRRIKV